MKVTADHRYLEFIARLRAARKRLGISQKNLAARLGKPQSYVSKVETCERRLDLVETLTICEALGITLEAILPVELQHLLKSNEEQ